MYCQLCCIAAKPLGHYSSTHQNRINAIVDVLEVVQLIVNPRPHTDPARVRARLPVDLQVVNKENHESSRTLTVWLIAFPISLKLTTSRASASYDEAFKGRLFRANKILTRLAISTLLAWLSSDKLSLSKRAWNAN